MSVSVGVMMLHAWWHSVDAHCSHCIHPVSPVSPVWHESWVSSHHQIVSTTTCSPHQLWLSELHHHQLLRLHLLAPLLLCHLSILGIIPTFIRHYILNKKSMIITVILVWEMLINAGGETVLDLYIFHLSDMLVTIHDTRSNYFDEEILLSIITTQAVSSRDWASGPALKVRQNYCWLNQIIKKFQPSNHRIILLLLFCADSAQAIFEKLQKT